MLDTRVVVIKQGSEEIRNLDEQDGLDRMLMPLGTLSCIRCPHCNGVAHSTLVSEQQAKNYLASSWCCHTHKGQYQQFIGIASLKLPQISYDILEELKKLKNSPPTTKPR